MQSECNGKCTNEQTSVVVSGNRYQPLRPLSRPPSGLLLEAEEGAACAGEALADGDGAVVGAAAVGALCAVSVVAGVAEERESASGTLAFDTGAVVAVAVLAEAGNETDVVLDNVVDELACAQPAWLRKGIGKSLNTQTKSLRPFSTKPGMLPEPKFCSPSLSSFCWFGLSWPATPERALSNPPSESRLAIGAPAKVSE